MLDRRAAGRRAQNRGTILIASTDSTFLGIVGRMVVDSGFTPAYPADREAPWLSVTRTQPCIAICDWDAPVEQIQQLVSEACARHVPVASLTSPVSYEAFASMLDALGPSVPRAVKYMTTSAAGGSTAGDRVRTLSLVRSDLGSHEQ
jgi:hypothetical protein